MIEVEFLDEQALCNEGHGFVRLFSFSLTEDRRERKILLPPDTMRRVRTGVRLEVPEHCVLVSMVNPDILSKNVAFLGLSRDPETREIIAHLAHFGGNQHTYLDHQTHILNAYCVETSAYVQHQIKAA